MSNKPLQDKLAKLAERNYRLNGVLPIIIKGSSEWHEWRTWRLERGLGVSFFDTRDTWTVPCDYPPVNIDMQLQALGSTKTKMLT